MFMHKVKQHGFRYVSIYSLWLDLEDYPVLLGSADIGISLHKSSSGCDLPMKVVDMLGCSLPVCAINYKCIGELVQHNHNGMIFNDASELSESLQLLLVGFKRCMSQSKGTNDGMWHK